MKYKLMVLILSKVDTLPQILSEFMNAGIKGTTIVDCEGMLRAISDSDINPPPIFGSLRRYLNPERPKGKLLFTVLPEETITEAKNIVDKAVGGLDTPNTGICFTVPLDDILGI